MADKFEIDVPINEQGGSSSSGSKESKSDKEAKKNNELLKKLDKSVLKTVDIYEIATQLFSGLIKLLQPLLNILNVLFLIIFLPFLPLIKDLTKAVAGMAKFFGGKMSLWDYITTIIGPAIVDIVKWLLKALWDGIVKIVKGFVDFFWEIGSAIGQAFFDYVINPLMDAGSWVVEKWFEIWDNIFSFIAQVGKWIWEKLIKPPFMFLAKVGEWIWNQIIKPAFEWLKDVGSKIWNILSAPFRWLADKIRSFHFFGGGSSKSGSKNDFLMRPGKEAVSFSPQDTIIGVKDASKLGGGNYTININNPTVRSNSDLREIANQVSRVLQRQMAGRMSSG